MPVVELTDSVTVALSLGTGAAGCSTAGAAARGPGALWQAARAASPPSTAVQIYQRCTIFTPAVLLFREPRIVWTAAPRRSLGQCGGRGRGTNRAAARGDSLRDMLGAGRRIGKTG